MPGMNGGWGDSASTVIPRQRLSSSVATTFGTERRHERPPKTRLDLFNETREPIFGHRVQEQRPALPQ
jgi:hypothetical protein